MEKIDCAQKSSGKTAVFLSPAELARRGKACKRRKGLGNAQECQQQDVLWKMCRK